MPFKANRDRRHRMSEAAAPGLTNWAEYDAGLRARGSLSVWFTAEAIEAWKAEPHTPIDWDTSQADDFAREVSHGRSSGPG